VQNIGKNTTDSYETTNKQQKLTVKNTGRYEQRVS